MNFYRITNGGIELAIRLSPKASKNSFNGFCEDEEGNTYLKVSVTAIAEDGKANQALIDFLAKQYRIPKSSITILRGHTFRNKILLVQNTAGLEEIIASKTKIPPLR